MKLMTKAIIEKLPDLYSQENETDPICHLKFFTPDSNWTWFVIEGRQENGDWLFLAKVFSHLCPEGEVGYVRMSELLKIKGAVGLPIERDKFWSPKPLSECKMY